MGYYATGGGDIKFRQPLSAEQKKEVLEIANYWFDYCDFDKTDTLMDVSYDGKYYCDFDDNLQKIASIAQIEQAEIYFTGEDSQQWKFIHDGKEWKEVNARVIYQDEYFIPEHLCNEFVGQIIDIFDDFLESKGIDIPNEDKAQSENPAIIYGMDYGEIQSELESMMMRWHITRPYR